MILQKYNNIFVIDVIMLKLDQLLLIHRKAFLLSRV